MRKILYIVLVLALALGVWLYMNKKVSKISLNLLGTEATQDEVVVESPRSGDSFQSGDRVTGRARGPWYFEASAPVKVSGPNGESLGGGYVTAQGEWMTNDFVPFSGTISFDKGTNKSGYLIFMNDNPSGEESRLKYTVVPVDF